MTDGGQSGADEFDGFKDGHDKDHWFQAEPELTTQDIAFPIENDAVLVRLALENFPASILVISISARSVLMFTLKDDASNHCEGINPDLLRVIWLPLEVDSARVTWELDDRYLARRLPLVAHGPTLSKSACI